MSDKNKAVIRAIAEDAPEMATEYEIKPSDVIEIVAPAGFFISGRSAMRDGVHFTQLRIIKEG